MCYSILKSESKVGRLFIDYLLYVRKNPPAERNHPFCHVEVDVLDAISSMADSIPSVAGYCERMIQSLEDILAGSASDDQSAVFNSAYEKAEGQVFPVSTELIKHMHGMQGLTHNHSLGCIDMERMREMELDGHLDPDMKVFMYKISNRLKRIHPVQDYDGYSQIFEIYGEAVVYSLLRKQFKTERIEEKDTPTPDFQCHLNEKIFFVEVKSFDIVDGRLAHGKIMEEAVDRNIELEEQINSGKKVAIAEGVIAPFKKIGGDKEYDPRSLIRVVDIFREKARNAFKDSQFTAGPTIAVAVCGRLLIPGGKHSIAPYYYDFNADGSVVSGVLWHACFGKSGSAILRYPDFEGSSTLEGYLSKSGIYADENIPFPGVAIIVLSFSGNDIEVYGLFDRGNSANSSWSSMDTECILDKLCAAYNDSDNSNSDLSLFA